MNDVSECAGFRLVITKENQETDYKIAEVKISGENVFEITSVVSPNAADQSSLWFSFADYSNAFDREAVIIEAGGIRLCSETPNALLLLLEKLEPENLSEKLSEEFGFEYRVGFDVKAGGYSVYRFFEKTAQLIACGCSGKTEKDFILDWLLYRTAFAYPIIEVENFIDNETEAVKLHRVTPDYLDICLIAE